MGILLAFAPFIAFAIVDKLVSPTPGLIAGTVTSAILLIRDWVSPNRKPKVLEIGTAILFGGLAMYAVLSAPSWSIPSVRLRVDGGLLLIVLITIVIGKPFTLQYAHERTTKDLWNSPGFIRTNYIITAVWAVAFAILVIADLVLIYRPDLPSRVGIIATILALYGAFRFTQWYPARKAASAPKG